MQAHAVHLDIPNRQLSFTKKGCKPLQNLPAAQPNATSTIPEIKTPKTVARTRKKKKDTSRREGNWDTKSPPKPIEKEVSGTEISSVAIPKSDPPSDTAQCRTLGAEAFFRFIKQKGVQLYQISIQPETLEINHFQGALRNDRKDSSPPEPTLPDWLQDLEAVFSKQASDSFSTNPDFSHEIELIEQPDLRTPPLFRMSAQELQAVKTYIDENRAKGFIEPSKSDFGSPCLLAKKPGGGLRFCVDYRKLNAVTRKNRYPLPLIDETLAKLEGARWFSKVDVRQAFHKIRMHPDSRDLTTFRTRYGSYKYNVMPFGLCNGPSTFQHYINDALMDCLDRFCSVFVDDILIYSKSKAEHRQHVREVLKRLQEVGLQADLKKCEFEVTETRFLGLVVSREGIKMDPAKIQAILEWKAPSTVKGVQSFLGLCNYYRRFIRSYSNTARPLTDLTRKDRAWEWTPKCQDAFERLKKAIHSDPVLQHFDPKKTTYIEVDSSDFVSGGVMMQKDDGGRLHPVAFFSKKLSPAECNYTIYDKELLAIVRAFEEWRPECIGTATPIQVFTDHETLKTFTESKQLSRRQVRWAEKLQDYNFVILPVPGAQNQRADALSRREQDWPQSADDDRVMFMNRPLLSKEQFPEHTEPLSLAPLELPAQPLVERLRNANQNAPELHEQRALAEAGSDNWKMEQGLLLFNGRLVVPTDNSLKVELLREAHDKPASGHPGERRTWDLLRQRYYWKAMKKEVQQYVRNCHSCKRAKHSNYQYHGLLKPLPIPHRPWKDISCDFVVRLPYSQGKDAVLVVVDRFTKMRHFIPCNTATTSEQTAELFRNHIWKHHGLPESIVSDRGPQFVSDFWKELCHILGIQVKLSTAYHPETDGQSENANKGMETYLRHFINHHQDDWTSWIASAEYAANANTSASSTVSPFFAVYGYEPRLSFDWRVTSVSTDETRNWNHERAREMINKMEGIWNHCKKQLQKSQEVQARNANRSRKDVTFEIGDKVFISARDINQGRPSRKLSFKRIGPYSIIAKVGHAYRLELPPGLGLHPVMHASKLSKDPNDPLEGQTQAPQPSILVEQEEEWIVEEILDSKKKNGNIYYLTKWEGHPPDPKWYPARNFDHAPRKLKEFHVKYPTKPGPPKELPTWLKKDDEAIE